MDRGPLRLILNLWRSVWRATIPVRHAARLSFVFVWRRLMVRTTVIGITGSVGKTTTKECLAAILSAQAPTMKTRNNENGPVSVPRLLCRLRPWHRYAVIEIGTETPGNIARSARRVRPDIAIVLTVAGTHANSFPTLEDMAAEKATILDSLPRDGIAILNGDDPWVRQMAERRPGKVVLFGQTSDCDVVAEDVSASWPDRLRFRLRSGGEELPVQTQLVGTHWVNSALAALAAAQVLGIPARAAVSALAGMHPFTARMQPVMLPSGAIVIRDEETGSPDSLRAMVKVLRESKAQRRVLVFSDVEGSKQKAKYRQRDVGKIAAELTDLAVFVGEHGRRAVNGAVTAGMDPANCFHEETLQGATDLLKRELREGDLVFIKGRLLDHLSRIIFAQFGPVGCWTMNCRLRGVCDSCSRLKPGFDLKAALSAPIQVTELTPSEAVPVEAPRV